MVPIKDGQVVTKSKFALREDVLSLRHMIPPKRFDIFSPVCDAQKV